MCEGNFSMSDTLDNFTFNDVRNESKCAARNEISFDDSLFLKNLSFDCDKNCGVPTSIDASKGILRPVNQNEKGTNLYYVTTLVPSLVHSNCTQITACSKHVLVGHNVCKENIPTPVPSKLCKEICTTSDDKVTVSTKSISEDSQRVIICPTPHASKDHHDEDTVTSLDTSLTTNESISANTVNNRYELCAWGLPDIVLEKYISKKITNMFPWQFDCLSNSKVLNDHFNLIYSAPTSAGKTLVAEILALKTIFERKKKVVFVLPFVSIVREKTYYFQDILNSSGVRVEGFMGSYNPPGGFSAVDFAICTIEKANNLINKLLEEGRLSEIGSVVVDEMHLLGDSHRGYILELLLTKLRYISLKDNTIQIQIIGMSATLPNLGQLARWLGAELYSTCFRPIPLYEQASVCGEIYDKNLRLVKKLEPLPEIGVDTDNILQLCLDTIKESCSVLIFCPTKNWCENLAQQLSLAFYKIGNSQTPLGELLRLQIKPNLVMETLEQLKFCPVSLDPILRKTISFGICFHHAGLTMDERDIIEGAFRNGAIKILVATSTLSSGVNLPARRVLIRSPNFYGRPLDVLTYRQMVGRAGRMGKDSKGESILICQKQDYKTAKELMSGELSAVESCLEGAGKLKRAILEVIASGIASSPDDVSLFSSCTLLAITNCHRKDLQDPIAKAIEYLKEHEFIKLQKTNELTEKYVATSLGKACLSSSIAPDEGLTLFTELEKARQCFVLETELHLIYLVTPYSACNSWDKIDWMFYLDLWDKLPIAMKRVGELVGVKESYIVNATRGKMESNPNSPKAYHKMMIHKRFFVALALQDLVNEVPLGDVCTKFSCNRGMLQSLQQSASTFAGMVTSFSRQLGWASVEILLAQFQDRMQFGVSRDLLDLMRLPSLNGKLARILYNGGLETVIQLANSDVDFVENILCKAKPFESSKMRDSKGELGNQQKSILKTVWIAGKDGLTESDAADLLVSDARNYLKIEIGLKEAKWKSQSGNNKAYNDLSTSLSISEINESKKSLTENILPNDTNAKESKLYYTENKTTEIISTSISPNYASVRNKSDNGNVSSTISFDLDRECIGVNEHCDAVEPVEVKRVSPRVQINSTNVTSEIFKEILNNKDLLDTDYLGNKPNNVRIFSDRPFTRFEGSLHKVLNPGIKQVESPQTHTDKQGEVLDTLISNLSLELNISESSDFSIINRSSQNLESAASATDDSFQLQLSDDSLNKKNENLFTQPESQFEDQSRFETLLQNVDISQEVRKSNSDNLCEYRNSMNTLTNCQSSVPGKRIRTSSGTSSEDSFLLATPTKKSKMTGRLTTPLLKKYSELSIEDLPVPEPVPEINKDFSKLYITDVCNTDKLIDTFFDELTHKKRFSFCVICNKNPEYMRKIGSSIFANEKSVKTHPIKYLSYKDRAVVGFAFCWRGAESYFLSIEVHNREKVINNLKHIFTDEERSVVMFDAKEQIKLLKQCCDIEFYCKPEDPKVADWLLDTERKEKSLQAMVKFYCKDLNDVAELCGNVSAVSSLGLNTATVAEPKLRGSVEVVVIWHLIDVLKKDLTIQIPKLNKVNITSFPTSYDLEMRTLLCLANAELCGMSISKIYLENLAQLLNKQKSSIEKKSYSMVGRRFKFSSSTDVSKIIGTFKGKKVSTRKQVLQENDHPISDLVLLWRKLDFIQRMVNPLIRFSENNRICGLYVSHTATGRITMCDPNIQMLPKDFNIFDPVLKKDVLISCRGAFSVPDNYTLVSADYCQLELRILTYLSKDKLLTNIMENPGDIFKSIAAKWNNITEEMVDDTTRQSAKQICYGIIYGMGAKTLAEKLGISLDNATHFLESFRNTYSGIEDFIKTTVDLARENGYVETITGRRRYLSQINHIVSSLKSQAERQAINTVVQGSAADIVKNAMLNIENKMNLVFKKSRFKPKLVLHLHDELIYEVPEKYIEKAEKIIKRGMENSASVFGHFPVKIKKGKSWGLLSE